MLVFQTPNPPKTADPDKRNSHKHQQGCSENKSSPAVHQWRLSGKSLVENHQLVLGTPYFLPYNYFGTPLRTSLRSLSLSQSMAFRFMDVDPSGYGDIYTKPIPRSYLSPRSFCEMATPAFKDVSCCCSFGKVMRWNVLESFKQLDLQSNNDNQPPFDFFQGWSYIIISQHIHPLTASIKPRNQTSSHLRRPNEELP